MRKRLRVRAITLSTVAGSLLVGAGDEPERVAELGADVNAGNDGAERIATWRLHVGSSELLLTSLGGSLDAELGAGVRRIFATTSESAAGVAEGFGTCTRALPGSSSRSPIHLDEGTEE
jgi:hypothetical protein